MTLLHYLTAPNQPQVDNEGKWPDINNGGNPWFSYSPNEPQFLLLRTQSRHGLAVFLRGDVAGHPGQRPCAPHFMRRPRFGHE